MHDAFDDLLLGAIGREASDLVGHLADDELRAGQAVRHYRVIEAIGEGGMAIVYKAEDEKLGRFVALKQLRSAPGREHDRRERLEREARTASALNHPAICTIHDVEEHDGHCVIVMEYLEGETLRDRLTRGPVPEPEAIDIALAVASALEAAHSRNIIHCDVKPANIFLTRGGHTKVLDFGIATSQRPAAAETRPRLAPPAGTRAYMSPEQARGEIPDQRTDVYALGAVLRAMVPAPRPPLARVIRAMMHEGRGSRPQTMADVATWLRRARAPRAVVRPRIIAAVAATLVIALAAGWWLSSRRAPLIARDWILIGDFANRTDNPIFNDILRDALAVQMGQSPYLNVFPATRIDEQLKLMRRPPDQRLTAEVAREICERAGLKAFVSGEIAPMGPRYVVRLDALNARTGDYLAREQVAADGTDKVLAAIDQAAAALRKNLGESYASIQRFDVPGATATTSSLDALRSFRQGELTMLRGTSAALKAVPYFKRAIELDPDFALAYARLAGAYGNARERTLSVDAARQAFIRRDRVSERERFAIASQYYGDVSGEESRAVEALEMWAQIYPQDPIPQNRLMAFDKSLGRLEQAASHGERAVALVPGSALYRSNLAGAYVRLTQLDKAAALCAAAIADRLDNSTIHRFLYTIAWMKDDRAGMAREDVWRARETADYADVELKASVAGAEGRVQQARALYAQAIELAQRQGLDDRAQRYRARLALLDLYVGHRAAAAATATHILATAPSRSVAADAVFVLAAANDKTARTASDRLAREFPDDEYVHRVWLPLTHALAELNAGRPSAARDELRLLDAYDRGDEALMRPSYCLGLAALAQHAGADARQAFAKIVENRGVVATTPLFALAHLGLARAAALDGQREQARLAYQRFFDLWKDADADLPIVNDARAEYATLGRRS